MSKTMEWDESYFPRLGKSGPVADIVGGRAEKAAAIARSNAPVASGEYRDGITVEEVVTAYRRVFIVRATADHSSLVESRTGNLVRAMNAASG